MLAIRKDNKVECEHVFIPNIYAVGKLKHDIKDVVFLKTGSQELFEQIFKKRDSVINCTVDVESRNLICNCNIYLWFLNGDLHGVAMYEEDEVRSDYKNKEAYELTK